MWDIVVSALGKIIQWMLTGGVIKWALAAILWGAGTLLTKLMTALLPDWFGTGGLTDGFSLFSPAMWYFWDYCQGTLAVSMIFGAFAARFLIRRIPFIG